jgi:aspartate kinase
MKVFKFGGASISNIERIKSTAEIIRSYKDENILIVISAMGKTTNALEAVVKAFFEGNKDEALSLFEKIKESHLSLIKYLLVLRWQEAESMLKDFFTEIEWMLHDKPVRNYDYYYDQVVCCGELFSSAILATYLKESGINAGWVDVRDIIRTDDNFRDAGVDWNITARQTTDKLIPLINEHNIVITQGFIGSTDENESTTLGREGSDYSAAIFAHIMDAESVTIWKDVEAVMNADPRNFPDAVNMPELSYNEVIEMAYYGAQVIHPKTIKPLQNKSIPLYVKSFLDPSLQGTEISKKNVRNLPPVIVVKNKQVLIQFRSRDYSFVEDKPVQQLHELFRILKTKPNLSQNTAISLVCSFDDNPDKTGELAAAASEIFDVELEKNLTLITIRHYTKEIVNKLSEGKELVLEQRTPSTIQMLVRSSN